MAYIQRNQSKTVGGVAYTRYLLLEGGWKDGRMELRKDGMPNTMSPPFPSKRRGTKIGLQYQKNLPY